MNVKIALGAIFIVMGAIFSEAKYDLSSYTIDTVCSFFTFRVETAGSEVLDSSR